MPYLLIIALSILSLSFAYYIIHGRFAKLSASNRVPLAFFLISLPVFMFLIKVENKVQLLPFDSFFGEVIIFSVIILLIDVLIYQLMRRVKVLK